MGCCMSAPNAQGSQQVIANNPESSRPVPAPRQDERPSRQHRSQAPQQRSQRSSGQQRQSHAQNSTGLRITYLQNPQVENIKHDKTVGEGVQKTLAYDTPKTQSELQAWREEFWDTRTSGSKEVWQLLRNACEADNETAQALVMAANLQLPQDSLTTAIDHAGVYYRVPICCIQSPENYGVDTAMDAMKAKKVPKEKQLNVKIRSPILGDVAVTVSNLTQIDSLKEQYLHNCDQKKVTEKKANISKLRFFYMGKELKDDFFLYSYDMVDNMVVQAMLRQGQ